MTVDAYTVVATARARGVPEARIARQLGLRDGQSAYGVLRSDSAAPAVVVVPAPKPRPVAAKPPPAPEPAPVAVSPPPPPKLTVEAVIAIAAAVTGTTVDELKGQGLKQHITRPRQFCYWLLRVTLGTSLTRIGYALGGKDHTSSRTGIFKTAARIANGEPDVLRWRDAAQVLLIAAERKPLTSAGGGV